MTLVQHTSETKTPANYIAAEALEQALGNPYNEENPINFAEIMDLDEREVYPSEMIEELRNHKFEQYYVPTQFGGKLRNFEEFLALGRVLSRRDLSLAITDAHTFLGSVGVWIGGSKEQKQRMADAILAGRQGCLAVTERHHGSDLNANTMRASSHDFGYELNGEKWPINKATMTDILCAIVRTNDAPNSRSLSLFLIEKDKLAEGSYEHLDKVLTLGIRGCDISGIRFENARLGFEDLIGKEGHGLELTLKGFQITRSMCAGLSLGAADSALRSVLRFVDTRQLYGTSVINLPHARATLAQAYIDLLCADALAIFGSRAMQAVPGQFSIWSAIMKYWAPTRLETTVQELSVILGSRFYFRDEHDNGIFQKIMRDNSIISLFDGSTIVNLQAIGLQFKQLIKRQQKVRNQEAPFEEADLWNILDLEATQQDFDFNRLDLFAKGKNTALLGWESLRERWEVQRSATDSLIAADLDLLIAEVEEQLFALEAKVEDAKIPVGQTLPPAIFELAKDYCQLHVATLCIGGWLVNSDRMSPWLAEGAWLVLALDRLMSRFRPADQERLSRYAEGAAQHMLQQLHENHMFSLVPFQLARD